MNKKKCTPSLAQSSYSSAAQRSAVRCRAAPCRALRYDPVPCFTVFSSEHTAVPGIMRNATAGTRYRYARVCSSLCLLHFFSRPFLVLFVFFFASQIAHPCTAGKSVTSTTSTQHNTGQSGLHKEFLGFVKSLVAPNHGPLPSAPFTFCCILPFA